MTVRGLLVACVAVTCAFASGQKVQCVPKKTCDQEVVFAPTEQVFASAPGGTLEPTTWGGPWELDVNAQGADRFTVTAARSPWVGPGDLDVELRAGVTRGVDELGAGDWVTLSVVPRGLVSSRSNRLELAVSMRWLVRGDEAPGVYTSRVTFELQGEGRGASGKTTVVGDVRVVVPSFLALRLGGTVAGQRAEVRFDLGSLSLVDYLNRVSAGAEVPLTGATFQTVDVATNNPAGYVVTVDVSSDVGAGGSIPVDALLLEGQVANGRTFVGTGPTQGFVPLFEARSYGLRLTGAEAAGAHTFVVTFAAAPR